MKKKQVEDMMKETLSLRLPTSLYQQLKAKAGYIPIAVVIRRLIEKFVKGEVNLD